MIRIEDIKRVPLLRALEPGQAEGVAAGARRVRLAEGESLFEQGDQADRFFFVESGEIKLARIAPEGNEKVIEVVYPGHTFAEALMFLERPRYPVSARAVYRAEVFSFDAREFLRMLRGSASSCLLLLGDMSERLHRLIREIDDLTLHSATARVASYLIDECPGDRCQFDLPLPKGVLASRLSVKPETFSRIIKNLVERGLISMRGSEVIIRNRDGLAHLGREGMSI